MKTQAFIELFDLNLTTKLEIKNLFVVDKELLRKFVFIEKVFLRI
jgi:hypothetical protein